MQLLLVEDDIDLGQVVFDHLEAAGHGVSWMKLIAQADTALTGSAVALVLLDLHLPDGDGLQWLQRVRARGDPRPVIAITARDQIGERIRGLRVGADDYLVKPFDLDEMLARIDAVARRLDEPRARAQHHRDVTIDFTNYRATRAGAQVEFTAMEWSVLRCLAQPPRRIWSRTQIEVTVAGHKPTHVAGSNSLEVIVSRLRKKLGDELISTHRGLGYRLED